MLVATMKQSYFNSKMNESDLDTKSSTFIDNTKKSSIIGKVSEEIKDTEEKQSDYSKKLITAQSGNRGAIVLKNEAKTALQISLEFSIIAINNAAKGNVSILTDIGVPLNKSGSKRPPVKMEKPAGLTANNTSVSGRVKLEVKTAVGARYVIFHYSPTLPTATTVWATYPSTGKSCIVSDLTPLTTGYFRAVAVGSRDQQIPGDVISLNIM